VLNYVGNLSVLKLFSHPLQPDLNGIGVPVVYNKILPSHYRACWYAVIQGCRAPLLDYLHNITQGIKATDPGTGFLKDCNLCRTRRFENT